MKKTFHIQPYERYTCVECNIPFGVPAVEFDLEPSNCPYCTSTEVRHV